jgi:hypothetical protein
MPKKELDALAGEGLSRVFIAGNVREAERAEQLLDAEGLDYVLQAEPFVWTGFFGPMNLQGMAFYVRTAAAEGARARLAEAGLKKGVVQDEADEEEADPPPPP